MQGINTGILSNAKPLSALEADQVQLACIENKEIVAYVDEHGNVCFAGPTSYGVPYVEQIKDLAWSEAYEVHKLHDIGTGNSNPDYYYDLKRAYKKRGKNDYELTGLFAHIWDDPGDGGSGKRQWMKWPDFMLKGMDDNPMEPLPALIADNGRIPAQCTIKRQRVGEAPIEFNAGDALPELQQGDLIYADLRDNSADHMPVSGNGLYLVMQDGFSTLAEARHAFYNQIRWALVFSGEAQEDFLAASDTEVLSMLIAGEAADEDTLFSALEIDLGITGLTVESFKASQNPNLFISLMSTGLYDVTPATFFLEAFGLTTRMIGLDYPWSVAAWQYEASDRRHQLFLPTCIERIGSYAFADCHNINAASSAANIPLTICNGAFANASCDLLVPFGSMRVKPHAFSYCTGQSTAIISGESTSVCASAFEFCDSLTSATICNGVTSIVESAFRHCTRLTCVDIPNSVTSIGDYAFFSCTGLTSITYKGTMAEWNAIEKGADWVRNVPCEAVQCTDGQVTLQ